MTEKKKSGFFGGERADTPGNELPQGPGRPEEEPARTMHVRALVACYIDGVYRYPGDEFDIVATAFNGDAMELAPVVPEPPPPIEPK